MNNFDLDSILDSALDDFEENDMNDQIARANQKEEADRAEMELELAQQQAKSKAEMEKLMSSLQDPSYGPTLQNTLRSLSNTTEGIESVDDLFASLSKQFDTNLKPGFMPNGVDDDKGVEKADREVAETLQMIGQAQKGMEGFEAGKMEEMGENVMEEMMAQFESLGEKEDYAEVVDGVMRQLLSKDLMYTPARMICNKFPEWLAIHKKSMSESEYINYGKQYQSFQKILAVYDTEPDNFPRLMELMFDMQQYGQPPSDIIRDLAPGLKFDENGMPIMPNMGAGMFPEGGMPGMPGGEGLPNLAELSQNMAQGQCTIC